VNCHTHLELAWLAGDGAGHTGPPGTGDMIAWIRALLDRRANEPDKATILAAGRVALERMTAAGTILVTDIGNDSASATIGTGHPTRINFLHEMLGLPATATDRLAALPAELACTPHAPYSTGPELIKRLKERASQAGQLFSIHVAESAEEIRFLMSGDGPMRDFLIERGAWTPAFMVPGTGAISYLDRLRVLDRHTLCVHCVQLTTSEIDLLARRGAKVCLCPGSNRHIGVGRAPVPAMLQRGLLPGLGTDSLASNTSLSLWEEMRILRQDWPEIDPAVVFAMATSGGSLALGLDDVYGLLAPGRTARFLAVPLPARLSSAEIFPCLTTAGNSLRPHWIEA
jgi:cytosine/adenosine deaminase-related metal-dependent hydrolase